MSSNLIEFGRMFLSYLFVLVIIVAVCAVAIVIGIRMRKAKNAKEELENAQGSEAEG